jgi:hypothetical protein
MRSGPRFFQAIKMTLLLSAIQLCISLPLFGATVHTPPEHSAERKAILEALRQKVEKLHHLNVVFVVNYLKVHNGWAWIETSPQSPDGTSHYEPISALLDEKNCAWCVAEIACTEPDNPNCLGSPDFFQKLRARFPQAPADIFPH